MELNILSILYGALAKSQQTLGDQQNADSQTTLNNAQNESKGSQVFYGPNGILKQDADKVTAAKTPEDIQKAQTQYNLDSSRASSYTSQMDGMTQASQQQANNDGTNLQMLAQVGQMLNSISSALYSLLARGILK
jgi:hypothetical protein